MHALTLKKYVLPGLVFQSLVIAGGYGTGRELAEFFLSLGPVAGVGAMLGVSMVIWSAVAAVSFEFARTFRSTDYRTFFTHLLGRWWWLFEACYIPFLMIVLAVIAAAAGSILRDLFGLPYAVGVIGMMASVGFLVFRGSDTIERFLTGWSVLLYVVYAILFLWCFVAFGDSIRAGFASGGPSSGWALGGVKYAAYNLAAVPLALFTTRHLETRKEAVGAGLLAGPIAIIPGLLFLVCMVGQYPAILEREVPANYLLELLDARWFQLIFQVVLFGTLVETGTGMIHAINERIDSVYRQRERQMPSGIRPAVAIGLLVLGTLLARVGIIDLIARGYGTLTWFFLLVYVIPILTLGVWRLRRASMQRDIPVRDA